VVLLVLTIDTNATIQSADMSFISNDNPKRMFPIVGMLVIGITAVISVVLHNGYIVTWGIVAGLLVWFYGIFVYNDITKKPKKEED
jgi:hypothetical protein